ncbi:hypothetical protein [Pseudonocardia sp. WMMC193]|uniref:hypothetical protein n=1 Tax=Pseudonocardia sp. WMMC193 TaxID=2911965 RepID=UPI001F30DA2E|nr:hypothetical protein [Pseudonocardia sp. WMMC193]MCF7547857.1 hypothetical protein [Pseudonocardia sp. WMMC193]
MSLAKVWLQLRDGDLVRADRVDEITVHPVPRSSGPERWLVDVVVPVETGAGDRGGWRSGPLHRTLAQCDGEPHGAQVALARLLARLDELDAAGVVHAQLTPATDGVSPRPEVRFLFSRFDTMDQTPPAVEQATPAPAG